MYKMQQNFATESKKESKNVLCISDSYVIKLCKFKYKRELNFFIKFRTTLRDMDLQYEVSLVPLHEKHTAISAYPVKLLSDPQDYAYIHTLSDKCVD